MLMSGLNIYFIFIFTEETSDHKYCFPFFVIPFFEIIIGIFHHLKKEKNKTIKLERQIIPNKI